MRNLPEIMAGWINNDTVTALLDRDMPGFIKKLDDTEKNAKNAWRIGYLTSLVVASLECPENVIKRIMKASPPKTIYWRKNDTRTN